MSDNLADLDKSGTNCQFVRVNLGPTLGWQMVPVTPELLVTTVGTYTVPAFASRILLQAATTPIVLPSVSQWMKASLPLANRAGFDRSLWVKDLGGNASSGSPITIMPAGADTIDGLATWQIITAYDLVRLYPLTNLTGWYTG